MKAKAMVRHPPPLLLPIHTPTYAHTYQTRTVQRAPRLELGHLDLPLQLLLALRHHLPQRVPPLHEEPAQPRPQASWCLLLLPPLLWLAALVLPLRSGPAPAAVEAAAGGAGGEGVVDPALGLVDKVHVVLVLVFREQPVIGGFGFAVVGVWWWVTPDVRRMSVHTYVRSLLLARVDNRQIIQIKVTTCIKTVDDGVWWDIRPLGTLPLLCQACTHVPIMVEGSAMPMMPACTPGNETERVVGKEKSSLFNKNPSTTSYLSTRRTPP